MTNSLRACWWAPWRARGVVLAACAWLAAGCAGPATGRAAPASFERAAAASATRRHLQALVALDTRNPPGNEALVAAYLDAQLAGLPGVTTHVLPTAEPGRANFVARLTAPHATARPVLVLAHMDVVGVQAEAWDTDPLQLVERDGYLYGRGVIDDKGMLAAVTTAFTWLSAQRDELARDVILLATAAEEGGPAIGVDEVIARHRELLGDAEFALNEGGRVRLVDGRVQSVNVQTTEKIAYNVAVHATGPSGHGSVPLPDNALAALARAVARVHDWRPPYRLNDTTRRFFAGMARLESDPDLAAAMADLVGEDGARAQAAAERLSTVPIWNAVLRTGASLTLLDGGFRNNVIPGEGTANFNVRVLPNDDVLAIVAAMQEAGGESAVRFSLEGEPRAAPPVSPVDTALYRALAQAADELAPGTPTLPFMSTGATDGAALRAIGIPTYGILPFPMQVEDELRMHGDNERMPVASLGWGAEYVWRVLDLVAREGGAR